MKKLIFVMLLAAIAGSVYSDGGYDLPDDRRALINDGPKGQIIHVTYRDREIVDKGNEVWIELLSGVKSNVYVTLIFSKDDADNRFDLYNRNEIDCLVTGYRKTEHEVMAGDITTYYLSCIPLSGDFGTEISSRGGKKIYQLREVMKQADFDYSFMKNIDNQMPPYPAEGNFQIGDFAYISGSYTLYKFVSTYWGNSSISSEPRLFHDLLVVKTDRYSRIIDAYHYTLEWSDAPSRDLYYAEGELQRLDSASFTGIEDLNFRTLYGDILMEEGVLDSIIGGVSRF